MDILRNCVPGRPGVPAVQRPNNRSLPGIFKKQQGDRGNDMQSQHLEGIL